MFVVSVQITLQPNRPKNNYTQYGDMYVADFEITDPNNSSCWFSIENKDYDDKGCSAVVECGKVQDSYYNVCTV